METGLVVVHVSVTVQVLEPAAMTQEGAAGVSVPDMVAAETASGAKIVKVVAANIAMPVTTLEANRLRVTLTTSSSKPAEFGLYVSNGGETPGTQADYIHVIEYTSLKRNGSEIRQLRSSVDTLDE